MPSTADQWLSVANEFYQKWNFPNCVGSMDGKHVVLQASMNTGSDFYNYKGTFSIVLFAVVDAEYNFRFIDVGCQGRISDGGVFKHTTLYQKLTSNELDLPEDRPLPGRSRPVPFVLVGDEAFPLTNRIMKPFSGVHNRGSPKRNFNFRLSRARRVVENVFGISSSVFRVLRRPMLLEPEKATIVTSCIAFLHNFLRRNSASRNIYTPPGTFDQDGPDGTIIDGSWRQEDDPQNSFLPLRVMPRRASEAVQEIRNEFQNFLANDYV